MKRLTAIMFGVGALIVCAPIQAGVQSTATVTAGAAAGDGSADHITISLDGSAIAVSVNGVAQAPIPTAGLASLTVQGSTDDDTLTVDESGGLIPLSSGIHYDGASGFDTLELSGWTGSPLATTVTPGPTNDAGLNVHSDGTNVQKVFYAGLEPVVDVAAGTLTINGTNGPDTFNLKEGVAAGNALISLNNNETIEFKNKTTLTLNGLAGDDSFNLAYPFTPPPAALTGIFVNGGDPSASDTLIVNGVPGQLDNLRDGPTNTGAGTVVNDNAAQVPVTYNGVEHVQLTVQAADGDSVRADGTGGDDSLTYTPGATADAGSFSGLMDTNNTTGFGPFPMTPVTFSGASMLANDVDVNFFVPGGTDRIQFNGTGANDVLGAQGGEAGGLDLRDTVDGQLRSHLETFNFSGTTVAGLGGDDVFNRFAHNVGGPLTLIGGSGANDAVAMSTFANVATTLDLQTSTITTASSQATILKSIENVGIAQSGATPTLAVTGTPKSDAFTYASETTTTATLRMPGGMTLDVSGATQGVSLDPAGGANSVRLLGGFGSDTFFGTLTATTTTGTEGGSPLTLTLANVAVLGYSGDAGLDIFNIATDPSTSPKVQVDGGDPAGKKVGDQLNITTAGKAKSKIGKAGAGAGNVSITYPNGGGTPFFGFTGVENVKVKKA